MEDLLPQVAHLMAQGRLFVLYGIPTAAAVAYVVMVARAIRITEGED